jgi:hypothetical protein
MIDPVGSPPRGGGGRLFAFLLAVVFLAVLGSSVGYLVGRQVNQHRLAGGPSEGPGETPDTSTTNGTGPAVNGTACPKISERDAVKAGSPGGLAQIRYIETARSQAWICRDSAGKYWYQGHNKAGPMDSDQYGILIGDVQDSGDGAWAAVHDDENGHTRYLVYHDKLVIEVNGKKREPEVAIHTEAG